MEKENAFLCINEQNNNDLLDRWENIFFLYS